jgi:uncharacterized membrane protein YfcA
MDLDQGTVVLVVTTLVAAIVNGAIGYGFSSLTVPVALLFLTNRLLNPALVLIELFMNLYALFINRSSVRRVWHRVWPIIAGLLPGVALGSYLLASIHPGWAKFATYVCLLPILLVQSAGFRRPIRAERLIGFPFGAGLGFLYAITTISGPPLAVLFNNQGLAKTDFRASLALIRVAESSLTAIAYWQLGLFTAASLSITYAILPGVLVGIPLGAYLIRHIEPDTFRRACISLDVWIVAFGLSRVILELGLAPGALAYVPMVIAISIDSYLLAAFISHRRRTAVSL